MAFCSFIKWNLFPVKVQKYVNILFLRAYGGEYKSDISILYCMDWTRNIMFIDFVLPSTFRCVYLFLFVLYLYLLRLWKRLRAYDVAFCLFFLFIIATHNWESEYLCTHTVTVYSLLYRYL